MNCFVISILLIGSVSGKIQGTVVDEKTQEPVAFANVMVLGTDLGAATDANGSFYILSVPAGKYTVEVSFLGYQTKQIVDVVVEYNKAVRLAISLTPGAIELSPVIVTSERPAVSKDMVGTTYMVRKSELPYLPVDYTVDMIAFQAAVARTDTTLHVRGGRATEVLYMIDNVSIIDPQTGDPALTLSKGVVDEVIFLPGGFDVEYGRAMSGIINMLTAQPADKPGIKGFGKTEKIMPTYYDFGYENLQSSVQLPVSKKIKGFLSFDAMRTDDWDPRLYQLPHKERQDYSVYGKLFYALSNKLKLRFGSASSRTQFDRYSNMKTFYKFHLDHYRSDMRKGNMQSLMISYLHNPRTFFNLDFSRLHTNRIYGVREPGAEGILEDFVFRPYETLEWPRASNDNPFGATYYAVICEGDYPEYQDKHSTVLSTKANVNFQLHRYHEVKVGFEYAYNDLNNFTYYVSDTAHQVVDQYHYTPDEFAIYLQDNIDYLDLYAKIGCRYDRFSSGIPGVEPKDIISPRVGVSFQVTEDFIFRANLGMYAQRPLYDYMYGYYNLLPFPSYLYKYLPNVGNPDLKPERTMSYEMGLQGAINPNMSVTVNAFYKDVTDLIGTRFISLPPSNDYYLYDNIEYANVKGIESILEFGNSIFNGRISYTLSYTKGTSSYAGEYADTLLTQPVDMYYLDFDQRHRVFVQGVFFLPFDARLHLFGYLGNGFPYTPPGPEGKYEERNILNLPTQKQLDCVLSKSFRFGGAALNISLEVLNLLDERYEITYHATMLPVSTIKPWHFRDSLPFTNEHYHPAMDLNHDGLVVPFEEYLAFRGLILATDDWVSAYSAPRRVRLSIGFSF
ncbi:MAG: TonB-dependent receptor [candidate division WOR-3 bacterium]|nr:MAG: TonB-dependent receptor [candidate division WOR-3 bacterium]